jgi:predicted metal-binding membrane protein
VRSSFAEQVALRSNAVTIVGLVILVIFAWIYLLSGAGMPAMPGMAPSPGLGALAFMWWVMMVAMMIPAASPTVLLFSHVHRSSGPGTEPPTAAFLAGYLVCWLGFALIAAGLQSSLISPVSMAIDSREATAILLIAAGLYQLSPFKDACLGKCRSPAQFLTRHYRPGQFGAFRLGILHGAYCVGCCWLLMALLFIGGVMNLVWVAGLATLVAAEKLLPRGQWLAKFAGVILLLWGAVSLLN